MGPIHRRNFLNMNILGSCFLSRKNKVDILVSYVTLIRRGWDFQNFGSLAIPIQSYDSECWKITTFNDWICPNWLERPFFEYSVIIWKFCKVLLINSIWNIDHAERYFKTFSWKGRRLKHFASVLQPIFYLKKQISPRKSEF